MDVRLRGCVIITLKCEFVILNEVKNLIRSMCCKTEILRLGPQNDIATPPRRGNDGPLEHLYYSKDIYSSVYIRQYVIHTSEDGDEVRYSVMSTDQRDHLEVRKRRSSDPRTVGYRAPVADEIITVISLRGLDTEKRFSRRHDRPPADAEEM